MAAYFYLIICRVRRLVIKANPVRLLVLLAFALILGMVAVTVFFISRGFFRYLSLHPLVFQPFSLYIFQTIFLGLFVFSVGSYIFLFYQRFTAKDTIVFKLPAKSNLPVLYKSLFETAVLGSWPFLALVVPGIIGFNVVIKATLFDFIRETFALGLYTLTALMIAALFVFLISQIHSIRSRKIFLCALSLLLVILSFYLMQVLLPRNLISIAALSDINNVFDALQSLPVASIWLPSASFATIIVKGYGFSFLTLAVVLPGAVLYFTSVRFGLAVWQTLQEGIFIAKPAQINRKRFSFNFPQRLTFLAKDLVILMRNTKRLGYLLFIFFLTFFYLAVIAQAPNRSGALPFYKEALVLAIILIPGYLLLTLLMQLAFPSLREEFESYFLYVGLKNCWQRLIREKLAFILLLSLVFVFSIYFAAQFFFKQLLIEPVHYLIQLLAVAVLLSTTTFAIGGLFTKLLKKEFADQTTNFPGLLATIAGILSIAVVVLVYFNYGINLLLLTAFFSVLILYFGYFAIEHVVKNSDLL